MAPNGRRRRRRRTGILIPVVVGWGPWACVVVVEGWPRARVVVARGAVPRFRPHVRVLCPCRRHAGFCGTLVRDDDDVGCVPALSSQGLGAQSGRVVVARRCVSVVVGAPRPCARVVVVALRLSCA